MIGLVADTVTPAERMAPPLYATCRGCRRPVHIGESLILVEHVHGPECLRRARERDRRLSDALDRVMALSVSVCGCLAALGAVLMVLRALGAVGPEAGR